MRSLKAALAKGRRVLPLVMTPSMSKNKPKFESALLFSVYCQNRWSCNGSIKMLDYFFQSSEKLKGIFAFI